MPTPTKQANLAKSLALSAFAASLALSLAATAARAQDECSSLWYQRNAIYKREGFCFKTSQAISAFGNAGCIYDNDYDVPLSRGEKRDIAGIVARERYLGCR